MNRVLYIVILLCFSATCTYAADGGRGKKKKKSRQPRKRYQTIPFPSRLPKVNTTNS